MYIRTVHAIPVAIATLIVMVGTALAKNVDLSTIPPRDTVQLTIYNSEDLTLVRETRHVTFKQGINPLQFSWANTLIDPTSVDLKFRTHAAELDVLDTTFPHDKPEMLYWNVRSAFDGDAVVEITYFTSGIRWEADYVCISDPAEEQMSFDGFVRIYNNSGEDYADAQVRLVVGTINLVEKIADLARRGIVSKSEAEAVLGGLMPARGIRSAVGRAEVQNELSYGFDIAQGQPKEVIKQGLSEYFLYTIEGTETIPNTWSKRMRSFSGADIPFRIEYRYRPDEYGPQLMRFFILRNDEASDLGTTPLPDGIVRLFRDNGHDGLSFLAQQSIKYVPIGQEIELNLGADREVIHEWICLRNWRDQVWFHRNGVNVYLGPEQQHEIQINDQVAGWDEHTLWTERIRNYRAKPISVEIRRSFDGDVTLASALHPTLHDYRTPEFKMTVGAGEKADFLYHVTVRNGYKQRQNRVELVDVKDLTELLP